MTSAQTMRRHCVDNPSARGVFRRRSGPWRRVAILLVLILLAGCRRGQNLAVNARLLSPYPQPVVWAVAPLNNETGTSVVDPLRVTDLLVKEVQQINGIDVVPLQRVLDAYRGMNIGDIQTPAEARSIARLVGADAVLIGSITAYDPYDPPVLGLTLELFSRDTENESDGMQELSTAASDRVMSDYLSNSAPISIASAIIDSSDNGVRIDLQYFAEGRTDPNTALGWRRYMKSMDLYTEYVSHHLIRTLLYEESRRISRTASRYSASPSF